MIGVTTKQNQKGHQQSVSLRIYTFFATRPLDFRRKDDILPSLPSFLILHICQFYVLRVRKAL